MKAIAARALNTAQARGASYADVRVIRSTVQRILLRNGNVEALIEEESQGLGVRVIAGGAWGFASGPGLGLAEVDRTSARAVAIARASGLLPAPLRRGWTARPAVTGAYRTPVAIDPFAVPVEVKIALLSGANEALRRTREINVAEAGAECRRDRKLFASTEGSLVEQELVHTGCHMRALAVGDGEVQQRSYPSSLDPLGMGGWELVQREDLPGNAPRIAEEAAALLTARPCPSLTGTLVLGGSQLALQVHESCGHATELDRIFGSEASFAGTSFLSPDKLGSYRYGSEAVSITADATLLGGAGSFGYDDEGTPAQRVALVDHGVLTAFLMSRETAAVLGRASNGCMRASGWNRLPIIRMTNVSLEPGDWGFEGLLADTGSGIYMETTRSWSIDDRRLNFQFGTEMGREIKGGRLGDLLRNPVYSGMTPDFWSRCDAVCNRDHWRLWSLSNCGKGEPVQTVCVGHGAAPARFRQVKIGVG